MEILNANSATLSNFEVMKHLQNIKDGRKKHKGQLATITYEIPDSIKEFVECLDRSGVVCLIINACYLQTLRYLEKTPCAKQTPETIVSCLKALEPFNLNKTEKLMIINTPPTTALEIQLLIEESEDRLTEEQVEQILQIIAQHFPHVQKQEEAEEPPE